MTVPQGSLPVRDDNTITQSKPLAPRGWLGPSGGLSFPGRPRSPAWRPPGQQRALICRPEPVQLGRELRRQLRPDERVPRALPHAAGEERHCEYGVQPLWVPVGTPAWSLSVVAMAPCPGTDFGARGRHCSLLSSPPYLVLSCFQNIQQAPWGPVAPPPGLQGARKGAFPGPGSLHSRTRVEPWS